MAAARARTAASVNAMIRGTAVDAGLLHSAQPDILLFDLLTGTDYACILHLRILRVFTRCVERQVSVLVCRHYFTYHPRGKSCVSVHDGHGHLM